MHMPPLHAPFHATPLELNLPRRAQMLSSANLDEHARQ